MRLGYKVLENGLGIVPDRITKIDRFAFYGCKTLRKIRIPEGITTIGSKAFCGCSSLEEVELPKSLITIESKAFYKCPALNKVTFAGKGEIQAAPNAFEKCPHFSGITRPSDAAAAAVQEQENKHDDTMETAKVQEQEIKCSEEVVEAVREQEQESSVETVEAKTATVKTKIRKREFYKNNDLKEYTIPDGVTEIGDEAFFNCDSLRNINIPNGVREIGKRAFYGCRLLKSITIPSSVETVGVEAFSDCEALKSVDILGGISEISNSMFYRCTTLQKVSISEGVKSIRDYAFCGCVSLESINIPESLTKIGENVFNGCKALKWITLPDGQVEDAEKFITEFKEKTVEYVTSPYNVAVPKRIAIGHCGGKDVWWKLCSVNVDISGKNGIVGYELCLGEESVDLIGDSNYVSSYQYNSSVYVGWENWLSDEDKRYIWSQGSSFRGSSHTEYAWTSPIDMKFNYSSPHEFEVYSGPTYAEIYLEIEKMYEGHKNHVIKFG